MTSAEVIPTNHTCTNCGAKVIRATLAPPLNHEDQAWDFKWIDLDPDWEHGGNIVVKASEAGRLFAKDCGTSPEEKRLLEHRCAKITIVQTRWNKGEIEEFFDALENR